MASSALAGLLSGISGSPLGNIPQLMLAREELQFQREQRADAKQFKQEFSGLIDTGDFEGAKTLALSKGNFELAEYMDTKVRDEQDMELAQVYGTGGLPALREAALSIGRPDAVLEYENLGYEREKRKVELGQGRANIEATRTATAAGKFNLSQSKAEVFSRDLFAAFTGLGPNAGPQDVQNILTQFTQANSEDMRKAFNLPKHRTPVGFEVAPSEDGDMLIVPTIYNTQTKSAGPMTDKGTPNKDDRVRPMRLSSFMTMMAVKGGMPMEELVGGGKKPKWKAIPGGKGLYDEHSGRRIRFEPTAAEASKADSEWTLRNTPTGDIIQDSAKVARRRALVNGVRANARKMGYRGADVDSIASEFITLITSDNRFSRAINKAKTAEEQATGLRALYEHLGLVQAAPMEAGLAGADPQRRPRGRDTNPGATMPRAPGTGTLPSVQATVP